MHSLREGSVFSTNQKFQFLTQISFIKKILKQIIEPFLGVHKSMIGLIGGCLGNSCHESLMISRQHLTSHRTIFIAVYDFADATPTSTATRNDNQQKSSHNPADNFSKLSQWF